MKKDNTVIFKGGKNGIIIILDKNASFEQIKESLKAKIRQTKNFFGDAETSLGFKGKELSESELLELVEIINTETDLSISFIEDFTGDFIINKPPTEDRLLQKIDYSLGTHFHRQVLRSGQAINCNGNVIILGDVNAGAEVIATGSIIVYGSIRGLAHAGCMGNSEAIICALSFQPSMLRIADRITNFPQEVIEENKKNINPCYAFVKDADIYILQIGG